MELIATPQERLGTALLETRHGKEGRLYYLVLSHVCRRRPDPLHRYQASRLLHDDAQ